MALCQSRTVVRRQAVYFSLIASVFLLILCPPPGEARIVNRLVAIVGNQAITAMNLQQAIAIEYSEVDFQKLPLEEQENIRQREMQKLIDSAMLAQKAAALGVSVDDEEIDSTIERVLKQNRMSREMLEQALARQELNFTSYRDKIAADLLQAKFISKEIKANIIITNQEILDYAAQHNLFSREESVTLAQIFIPADAPEVKDGEKSEIWETIRRRLKNGESFATLAGEFSKDQAAARGGKLGTFKRGSMLAEIEESAYQLEIGEPSQVIKTGVGYHIILVTNRTGDPKHPSLTPEAEDKIKDLLYQEKLAQAMKDLNLNLRREYSVKILP